MSYLVRRKVTGWAIDYKNTKTDIYDHENPLASISSSGSYSLDELQFCSTFLDVRTLPSDIARAHILQAKRFDFYLDTSVLSTIESKPVDLVWESVERKVCPERGITENAVSVGEIERGAAVPGNGSSRWKKVCLSAFRKLMAKPH
eukprot:CFRG2228T1